MNKHLPLFLLFIALVQFASAQNAYQNIFAKIDVSESSIWQYADKIYI